MKMKIIQSINIKQLTIEECKREIERIILDAENKLNTPDTIYALKCDIANTLSRANLNPDWFDIDIDQTDKNSIKVYVGRKEAKHKCLNCGGWLKVDYSKALLTYPAKFNANCCNCNYITYVS